MGFIKRWNTQEIINNLQACLYQVNHPYNDGFTAWGCKQDLYRVKFALDEMLKNSPTFSGEEEWVEKEQVWKALNEVQKL